MKRHVSTAFDDCCVRRLNISLITIADLKKVLQLVDMRCRHSYARARGAGRSLAAVDLYYLYWRLCSPAVIKLTHFLPSSSYTLQQPQIDVRENKVAHIERRHEHEGDVDANQDKRQRPRELEARNWHPGESSYSSAGL